ncbi:ABC transporter substrate-binding protein [Oryzobacter telluris]|uniref:ABC transporter substrate-binding protein n=1 Tax=Oryzobacter telluris TaxID=3149179 RepID=UPI00370D99E5
MSMSRITLAVVAAPLLLVASACGSTETPSDSASSASVKEVVVGSVTDLSGPASVYGIPENQGAQLAVEEVNAKGGIKSLGGAKLKLKPYDTQTTPDQGATQAQAAVNDGVSAVLGGEVSDTVLAGTNVTHRAGIPWVNTGGAADKINQRGYNTVFSNVANTTQAGTGWQEVIGFVSKELGISNPTVATSNVSNSYGVALFDAWKKANSSAGYKLLSDVSYQPGTTDFSAVAARMSNSKADVLMTLGYPGDSLALTKSFGTQFKPSSKIWLATGGDSAQILKQVGGPADGTITTIGPVAGMPGLPPLFDSMSAAYQKKFNEVPTRQSFSGYTSMMFIVAALEKAASAEPAKIAAALTSVSLTNDNGNVYPSPAELKFTAQGTLENAPVYYAQLQNGKVEVVYPASVASAKPIAYGGGLK